jgi:hypothetical protein
VGQAFDPYRRWLGITPEEHPANHYRLLGLSLFEADAEVIEQAADRQISHVQQHKQGADAAEANAIINALVAARLCLLKPAAKAAYDNQLRAKQIARPGAAAVRTPGAGHSAAAVAAPPRVAPLRTAAAVPVAPVAAEPVMDFVSEAAAAPRRPKRGKGKSQSGSLVMYIAIGGAAVSLCLIGWVIMNAGTAKPTATSRPKPSDAIASNTDKSPGNSGPDDSSSSSVAKSGTQATGNDAHGGEASKKTSPKKSRGDSPSPADSDRDDIASAKSPAGDGGDADADGEPGDAKPVTGPVRPKTFKFGPGASNPGEQRVPVARPAPRKPEDLAEVPDEAAQDETRKLVREVYADPYKQAKKPADKTALAEKLMGEAAKSEDAVERYVLYSEARAQAVGGTSPALVVQVIQNLGDRFRVSSDELVAESLDQMNHEALPGTARKELAECLLPIAEREIELENYDLAKRLLGLAHNAAGKTNDKQLAKDIKSRGSELAELRRGAESLKTAQKTLDTQPEDPDANLAKGKYLCFIKGDWSAGLPNLAKGSDSSLREVARSELAEATAAEDQGKIGDSWWALAEAAKGREKTVFQSRAAHWYAAALPNLKGLSQTKASKRLEELAAATTKAKPAAAAVAAPASTPAVATPAAEKTAASGKTLTQRIKQAVKKDLLTRTQMGGHNDGIAFFDVSDYGVLVGFNFTTVARFNGSGYITSIQPIYQGQKAFVKGRIFGGVTPDAQTVMAKRGYAVAGLSASIFHYWYGMDVVFMAVDANGNLDPKDQYRSEWQGYGQQYSTTQIGGDGKTLIGIFGYGGDYLTGIGLVQLPRPQ